MQNWEFQGVIFDEQAQCPTVLQLDDRWRIYFAQRDIENRSLPYYIDVEPGNPSNIIGEKSGPVLELGKLGTFDHYGIIPSCVMRRGSGIRLYYVGWSVRKDVPYHNTAGVAWSLDNGESFFRERRGPVLCTNSKEPYFNGTSYVMEVGKQGYEPYTWLNWYMSCTGWELVDDKPEPRYHLKVATSYNGLDWDQLGVVALPYSSPEEGGISKATVIRDDKFRMWYSYRGLREYRTNWSKSYKIGYAESDDGITWTRKDNEVAIKSGLGWDQQMQCYPCVIEHEGELYMFYNGNNFGKTGFGYAILRDR